MRKYIFLLILVLFLLPFHEARSQGFGLGGDSVNVDMIPISPRAYQSVSVTLTSYLGDLDSATITWQINGKTEVSGKGIKKFSFSVGSISQTTSLDIIIVFQNGSSERKSLKIKPTDVDLIWQSESYVSPFYKGKALFSHQNKITFIALPHMTNQSGAEINPKNLIYKWSNAETVVDTASGYGKNVYSFNAPLISRNLNVTVEVTSPDSTTRGFARIEVPPVEPEVIIYRKDPLYGIEFQKALTGNINMGSLKEITVIGTPFYFGVLNNFSSDLKYEWQINGAKTGNGVQTNTQIFRQKGGVSGVANISLSVENTERILQFARNKFSIEFGQEVTNNSLF